MSNTDVVAVKSISYSEIATKLIQDRFLLTALELHTELTESGRESAQLSNFFSNPGNFEVLNPEIASTSRLSRSASQATLDSLDFTRFSEDGVGTDERIAVLEFELRKAKETINALRNNLTVATESETSTPEKGLHSKCDKTGAIKPHEQRALNFLINEYLLLHGYKLTSITFADENESQDFDDWDDVGLNISKPPELLKLYRQGLKQSGHNSHTISVQTELGDKELEELSSNLCKFESECNDLQNTVANLRKEHELLSSQIAVDSYQTKMIETKGSIGSESPERFEIIDKNSSMFAKKEGSSIDDNLSNNSFNTSDWFNFSLPVETISNKESEIKASCNLQKEAFTKEVFSLCYVNIPPKIESEILDNAITNDSLIHTVSSSLLKIIPNIILNKREEAIPLLISAVHLHPVANERDKLLQQLFNLKKRPSEAERTMILIGLIGIAKCSGESLVENELLPQCWLQLAHKYVERRLLVVEACTALIPYVSSQIRNSLILSMLQQMLEDKEEIVRETAIRSLSLLISLCNDSNKYSQCEQLAMNTLNDSNNNIVNLSTQILFPVLGKWALNEGRLSSSLLKTLLNKFNDCLKDTESSTRIAQSSDRILGIVNVLENLLPFLLMSVASNAKVLANIEKDMAIEIRPDLAKLCTNLTNPQYFYNSEVNAGMIIYEFDKYIGENRNESWPELDWVVDIMLPDVFNNVHHIEITQQSLLQSFMNLFSHICIVFGINFTKTKIRPLFETHVQNLEQILSNYNQFCPSLNVIPIYLSSVLCYCNEFEEMSSIFKRFLCALPLCGTPLDCLEITVRRLCEAQLQDIVVASLWDGVVHPRPLVRAAAASLFSSIVGKCNAQLLSSKVAPALVTLASDNDLLVRTATIPALGSLITNCNVKEIHDKAYMQLQSYISDTSLRENHTLLRQLIVTLGNVVNSCTISFRNDVALPQLSILASFTLQMTNQTRKIDLALALIEAFTNIVYSPLNKHSVCSIIVPGLRCLETVSAENTALAAQREIVNSMLRECDNNRMDLTPQSPPGSGTNKLSQNVNQGVEEMRQRVSKIFKPSISKPSNTLQGIFKKK